MSHTPDPDRPAPPTPPRADGATPPEPDAASDVTEPADVAENSTLDLSHIFSRPLDVRSAALWILAILAIFYTLYFARMILIPLVLAVLLSLLLWPPVRALRRIYIPESIGAGLVLALLVVVVGGSIYLLAAPATQWIEKLPATMREAEWKLRGLQKPIEKVREVSEAVEKATAGEEEPTIKVDVKKPGVASFVMDRTRGMLLDLFLTAAFLYFLLASGDVFLRKLVKVIPRFEDKRQAVEIVRQIQDDIATYIFTITVINLGLGVAVGVALHFIGLPNAVLWGIMAALLNYIPYVGAVVGSLTVGLVALVVLDSGGQAIFTAATYYGLSAIEGTFFTPMILGSRLTLNPVVIFIALTIWGWMWGIPGALLAVPIVAAFKIVCDRIEEMKPIGEFLGR
ncbi:MAG: AI-2E family transporter [Phycisphaerae bacterium]